MKKQGELCPQCHNHTLHPFIDPDIGGYVQCKHPGCGYTLTEASFDEAGD